MIKSASHGFSLLEVLVTLAMVALISTIVFRSLGIQVSQANRMQGTMTQTVSHVAQLRLVSSILEQTVAGWPEDTQSRFVGDAESIKGTTAVEIFGTSPGYQSYDIRLTRVESNQLNLVIQLDQSRWSILTLPESAAFDYYGSDGNWYDTWPPELADSFDIEASVRIRRLPLMVRLTTDTDILEQNLLVKLDNSGHLPLRASDLAGAIDTDF